MDRGADDLPALPASRRNLATKVQGTGRICRHLPVFLLVMFHVEQAGAWSRRLAILCASPLLGMHMFHVEHPAPEFYPLLSGRAGIHKRPPPNTTRISESADYSVRIRSAAHGVVDGQIDRRERRGLPLTACSTLNVAPFSSASPLNSTRLERLIPGHPYWARCLPGANVPRGTSLWQLRLQTKREPIPVCTGDMFHVKHCANPPGGPASLSYEHDE